MRCALAGYAAANRRVSSGTENYERTALASLTIVSQPGVPKTKNTPRLDFGINIKERFETSAKLFLDLVLAAFKDVHRHMRLASVFQLYRSFPDFHNFVGRQKPESIYKC